MNPSEFFEMVTRPNIRQAIEQDDNYRLSVNAVMSVDALYGVLFHCLADKKHSYLQQITPNRKTADDGG